MPIQIKAKRDKFRRCGIAHSAEAKVYPDTKFSKKELEILQAEPMLVVTEVEGGVEKTTRPKAPEAIAKVEAAQSIEELKTLAEGEDRTTVQEAIAKKGDELNAAAEAAASAQQDPQLTVKEIEEKVKTIETVEELNAMAEGEERKTALEAIEKRRAELTAPKE